MLLESTLVYHLISASVLLGSQNYSLTGQAHKGLLGFFQYQVLACMNNLWFDRSVGSCVHRHVG